jgi:hypothetical protein
VGGDRNPARELSVGAERKERFSAALGASAEFLLDVAGAQQRGTAHEQRHDPGGHRRQGRDHGEEVDVGGADVIGIEALYRAG